MTHAIIRNGTPHEIRGGFTDNRGIKHPANVLVLWSPQELAAIDVYPIVEGNIPDNHVATGSSLEWDGSTVTRIYTTEAIPLADAKAARLESLAERRWQAEEGGTALGGNPLATDRITQTKLTAAYIKATDDPAYEIASWKSGNGVFSSLDAATIIAAADAIEAHVQACFAREDALTGAIMAAADYDALDAVDIEAGWPNAQAD